MALNALFNKPKVLFETMFIYFRLYYLKIENLTTTRIYIDPKFKIKILEIDDLILFENFELPSNYIDIYLKRLNNKHYKCFAVMDEISNKMVYYSWINYENVTYCKEIKRSLNLEKDNACLFEDDNTHKNYRNLKLHTFVMNERLNFCLINNFKKVYIIIHPKNTPAVKTIKNFNFKKTVHCPIKYRDKSLSLIYKKISPFGNFS